MADEHTPHFFLIEADLEELEEIRIFIAADRQRALRALDALRDRHSTRDVLLYVEPVALAFEASRTFLIAALDARTSELTDVAVGYKAPPAED